MSTSNPDHYLTEPLKTAVGIARRAQKNAYAPYSGKCVGAAVLTRSGRIYPGCNVENESDEFRVCAERNALAAAVGDGDREIVAIVVVSPDDRLWPPCASCRRVIGELAPEAEIIMCNQNGELRRAPFRELRTVPFDPAAEERS